MWFIRMTRIRGELKGLLAFIILRFNNPNKLKRPDDGNPLIASQFKQISVAGHNEVSPAFYGAG